MNRIINKLKRTSVVIKITLIITLILIIPITFTFIFYYQSFKNTLLIEAKNKVEDSLKNMEMNMKENLETINYVINQLEYKQEFQYFLDVDNRLSTEAQNYYLSNIQNEFINIRYLYPNSFFYIAIYSSNNQAVGKVEWQYNLDDLMKKDYYSEIINSDKKIIYGGIRNSEFINSNVNLDNLNLSINDNLVLPIYLKIRNLTSRDLIGIVEIDIEITKLINSGNLTDYSNDLDYLLLQKNRILYQTHKFNESNFSNLNFKNNMGSTEIKIGSKEYIMSYSKSESTGLISMVMMSKQNIVTSINEIIKKIIILALLSVLFCVVLIYWIIKRMLNRLLVLNKMMGKIESGKFNSFIQDDGYDDEISHISKSFNRMASQLDTVIKAAIENENHQKEAQLQALQAQINPHFLYNTLENMRMQCEIDGYYLLGDNLAILGDLFRYTIKWGSKEVPFELEWKNLKNYISIMRMRYDDEMQYIMDCEPNLEDITIPKMILQPLVENCFNHGFKDVLHPWLITIHAYKKDNKLNISIDDNGSGISVERLEYIKSCLKVNKRIENVNKTSNSIGLLNVKQRIEQICKEGSNITIDSKLGEGTKLTIAIVLGEHNDKNIGSR